MAYDYDKKKDSMKSGHYTCTSYYSKGVKEANADRAFLKHEGPKKMGANMQAGPKPGKRGK